MQTLLEFIPYLIMIANYSILLGLFSYGLYQGLHSITRISLESSE